MREKIKYISIVWMALIAIIPLDQSFAQSSKLTKNISQSFVVEPKSTIDITNKYGQIIVNTWDKDSVLVEVEITAYGKNNEALSKTMARVDVDFKNFGDLLNIETILDRNSSVIKEMWNSLGDYSKTLISKNKISIDYELTIPETSSLVLDNKFGDVFVNRLDEETKIKVAHGDFKANELNGSSKLNLSFGKCRITKLDKAFVVLKGAELNIRNGGDINVESSSSKIDLTLVQSLRLDSRNDNIQIEKIRSLRGQTSFTNIRVDSMIDMIVMDLNYGEVVINSINSNFSKVSLKSKTADLNLTFDIRSYFSAALTGSEDKMYLTSNFMGMDKVKDEENEKLINLTGVVGFAKPKLSQVNVSSETGEIIIYLEDTGGITNKN